MPNSFGTGLNLFNTDEGRVVHTPQGPTVVHAQLHDCLADTPAAGLLAAKNKSVSKATVMCRNCNAGQQHRGSQCMFLHIAMGKVKAPTNHPTLVTAEIDANHRHELETAPASKRAKVMQRTGIRLERHVFSNLNNFDIAESLPEDGMHDFLEGTGKEETKRFVHWLHKSVKVPLDTINNKIAQHPYADHEKSDKPSKIDPSHIASQAKESKMKQTAGQMLVLLRNIVYIFLAMITEKGLLEDPHWLSLCAFVVYFWALMSTEFSIEDLLLIEKLIARHIVLFEMAYGDGAFIPKHHYCTHFPYCTYMHGPMRLIMCMKFEAKHQWFKKLCNRTSWKNIMFTLDSAHQMMIAWKFDTEFHDAVSLLPIPTKVGIKQQVTIGSIMHRRLVALQIASSSAAVTITWIERMSFQGFEYKQAATNIVVERSDGDRLYGHLQSMLTVVSNDNSHWILSLQPYTMVMAGGGVVCTSKKSKYAHPVQWMSLSSLAAISVFNLVTVDHTDRLYVVRLH
jgi:hypothetical protein